MHLQGAEWVLGAWCQLLVHTVAALPGSGTVAVSKWTALRVRSRLMHAGGTRSGSPARARCHAAGASLFEARKERKGRATAPSVFLRSKRNAALCTYLVGVEQGLGRRPGVCAPQLVSRPSRHTTTCSHPCRPQPSTRPPPHAHCLPCCHHPTCRPRHCCPRHRCSSSAPAPCPCPCRHGGQHGRARSVTRRRGAVAVCRERAHRVACAGGYRGLRALVQHVSAFPARERLVRYGNSAWWGLEGGRAWDLALAPLHWFGQEHLAMGCELLSLTRQGSVFPVRKSHLCVFMSTNAV